MAFRHVGPSSLERRQQVAWACGAAPPGRRLSTSSNAVLSNTTSFLRNLHNGAEAGRSAAAIFLVGTAHVSKRSSEEVRDMIRLVKPASVMVELCPQRAARLRSGAGDHDFVKQMLASFTSSGGSLGQRLVKVGLPMMYRGLKVLGMDPGAEFKVALQEADRIGARVVHGDRDVQRTLQRLSETVDWQDLLRSLLDFFTQQGSSSLESQARQGALVEAMKTRAVVRDMCTYMRQVNPRMAAALIDERDEHMVGELSRLEGRVVGVLGLAHLDGMERRWEARMYSRQALAAPR
ncbi:hypothetical protein CHLNCDRAFT_133581 [Chlorella variabilis]|uniref:TraB domain-containing protein n=1 Tax=Chlorella variabilis TaxID=554065 RepID=E1Z3E4_CHLVA|nr:hypothetical protein CHLNCDRAFT_133581 [Chlorella variabilis]EFN60152.1 hypothetical protein CHLNCDRAFT_133581 [Chlorella variabilis]|eukprot:XP_005852254.1 hypothetical protein CHLNCDRAFT_133581 [Chlorella variabilis]